MLGVAAHIAGERGGGTRGRQSARFDPAMTDEERNSLANLLYVCRNCHERIDAHPHGELKYPTARLLDIKAEHEHAVAAAVDEGLATVTFSELAEATRWVTEVPPPPPGRDFSRVAIEDKIERNGLSLSSQNLIVAHLAVARQVRSFIQELSRDDPGFPARLISGFLEHYHKLRARGTTSGEDLFNSMCMFARRGFGDVKTQSAAQAVLVYLFETCEVFEQ
ncbi:MAG: HNH endonuclease [Gemmatimonadota bacterium]|nr:HNH endonuclease [Gemmatimonadota bacterium]